MKDLTVGTPKTLERAILNALKQENADVSYILIEAIREHVQDYLSQHFTSAMLKDQTLSELWERIVSKDPK